MYAYSYLCWRKLWFFAKDIVMEQENEKVKQVISITFMLFRHVLDVFVFE